MQPTRASACPARFVVKESKRWNCTEAQNLGDLVMKHHPDTIWTNTCIISRFPLSDGVDSAGCLPSNTEGLCGVYRF